MRYYLYSSGSGQAYTVLAKSEQDAVKKYIRWQYQDHPDPSEVKKLLREVDTNFIDVLEGEDITLMLSQADLMEVGSPRRKLKHLNIDIEDLSPQEETQLGFLVDKIRHSK